jgi:hypothetical protein
MSFNPSKCQVLQLTTKRNPIKTRYSLHGRDLEITTSAKYLGVEFSQDLKWNKHINNQVSKANRTLGFLKRNIKTRNRKIKEVAYKTMVRPQLEYASCLWDPYTATNIHKIEMVQRRAARWVSHDFSRCSSVTNMLQELNWRSLELRRADARMNMMYKITNGIVAIPSAQYLTPITRYTRHTHTLSYRGITAKKNIYRYSYFPITIVQWNSLPQQIISLPTLP